MPTKPNIILCICDQLRAFEVGCYGNPVIRTPHIDGLAAGGVRFETAVSNRPVCMAARSALMTGQYPRRCTHGIGNVSHAGPPGSFNCPEYPYDGRPHLEDATLPEVLRGHGYETAVIGKWHIHSWPDDVGFDHYLIPRVHHAHTAQLYTEDGGPEFSPAGYSVDYEATRMEQFLKERSKADQPFFLYYSISPPHCPLSDAPQKYLTMYDPSQIPLRANVDLSKPLADEEHWFGVYRWDYRYYNLHLPYTRCPAEGYDLRRLLAEYYGVTTWVDDCVGRLLAALARTGLQDDTLVVFTSDHGDNLGSHGLVQKGTLNDESIRIPYIVRGCRSLPLPFHTVDRQVGSLIDLMPSVLDLLGFPSPATVHGQSLAPVLRGETEAMEQPHAFIETHDAVGIRTPRHTYALRMHPETHQLDHRPYAFWDGQADPAQLVNPCAAPVGAALDAQLRAWHSSIQWPVSAEGD